MNPIKQTNKQHGFTIVELLVVIVVIGILAAITIVSYTGITQRAIIATLQSDLSNASNQLKIYQTLNGSYPTALNGGYCANSPVIDNTYCLKPSAGNSFAYSSNGTTFSLTETNTNSTTAYSITDNTAPTLAIATPIPASVYASPGTNTYTVPAGVTQIIVLIASGGGGGGGGGYNSGYALTSGGGGGGGAGSTMTFMSVTPGQQLTVVVGSGGVGGQGSNNNSGQTAGTAGTSSSVGTVSVSGGGGGAYGSGTSPGSGGSGGNVVNGSYNLSSPGYYGGWTEGYAGVGASSIFGQGGSYSTSAGVGSGGHGGQNNSGGTAGGNGEVVIIW